MILENYRIFEFFNFGKLTRPPSLYYYYSKKGRYNPVVGGVVVIVTLSDIRETLLNAWTDRSGFFFYFSVLLFLLFVMCVRFGPGAIWTLADWLPEESPEESQK